MYGSIDLIKQIMLIGIADTGQNSNLTIALDRASNYIDLRLMPHEATLPVASPSTILMNIAAFIGSGIFRKMIMPHDADEEWSTTGSIMLEHYIKNTYHQGTIVFTGGE